VNRRAIETPGAPGAIGPYSQGIAVDTSPHGASRWAVTAGQIGLDPATGDLVPGGVAEQTERALANLAAILETQGMGLANVVKTTVFLLTMDDFAAMNEVYAKHFPAPPPARTTVAVAGLPKGGRVEIEAWAVL